MSAFSEEVYSNLMQQFAALVDQSPNEQADFFLHRFILNPGCDAAMVMDQLGLFLSLLPRDLAFTKFVDFQNHGCQEFFRQTGLEFDSALVRNEQLALLSPNPTNKPKRELSFIEFLIYTNKDMILDEFYRRWEIPASEKISVKRPKMLRQAIWGELQELPMDADPELNALVRKEIKFKEESNAKIARLIAATEGLEDKQARGEMLTIKEKRALQEMEILRQGSLQEEAAMLQLDIRKRRNKVIKLQKAKMKDFKAGQYSRPAQTTRSHVQAASSARQNSHAQSNLPQAPPQPPASNGLPPGWAEYTDDDSGYTYYHHAASNATQWEKPTH